LEVSSCREEVLDLDTMAAEPEPILQDVEYGLQVPKVRYLTGAFYD